MTTKSKTFKDILTRSNKEISADRANRVSSAANREYKRLIDAKQEQIEKIEDQIESMLDLSTTNETTVDNSAKNFNAEHWVNKMVQLELQKEMLDLEIKVIREKVGKYFEHE